MRLKHLVDGSKKAWRGVGIFNDANTFLKNITEILSWLVGGAAAIGSVSDLASTRSLVNIEQMPFPLRFALAVLIACALGWLLGRVASRLSAQFSDFNSMLVRVSSGIFGAVLVFVADWMSQQASGLPELQVFTCIGLALSIWIAAFQFRTGAAGTALAVVRTRAEALLFFSATALFVLVTTQVAGT